VGPQISPSILSADFANLQAQVEAVANADWVHVDVMDNHFVPNLTIGIPVVESLVKVSPLPLDCHLMIDNPDRWAPQYADIGAHSVTFHIEAANDPRMCIKDIRAAGARVGMALKPGTDIESYADLLPEIDMLLVMTVEPGFGGQSFMADMMPKVRRVRELIGDAPDSVWLQVDGGVSASTIEQCAEAGADVFVAGSAVFATADPAAMVDRLRALASSAVHHH